MASAEHNPHRILEDEGEKTLLNIMATEARILNGLCGNAPGKIDAQNLQLTTQRSF